MNPTVSAIGMALNMRFERSPLGLNLEAHQDTAGHWQIGDGLTQLVNGTPVTEGMTLTPAEYEVQSKTDLRERERRVLELVKVEMNQYQFDALVLLAYNIGLDAFKNSDVLEMVNAGRWEDAAYHFGDWVYATIRNTFDADGSVIGEPKYGPDGVLLADGVIWKRAYRGLYRRHLSEACLALGFDSAEACDDEIELESEPEKTSYGWRDEVTYKTPWADVLRIAEKHPLPAPRPLMPKEDIVPKSIQVPDDWDTMTDSERKVAWLNLQEKARITPDATVTTKKKVIETPNLKPDAKPGAMEDSLTANGMAKKKAGQESAIIGGGTLGVTSTIALVDQLTGVAQEATDTATETTTFLFGLTLQQIMIIAVILGGIAAVIGGYRWIIGSGMMDEGRKRAEAPKV